MSAFAAKGCGLHPQAGTNALNDRPQGRRCDAEHERCADHAFVADKTHLEASRTFDRD
jgi:hypothetical protein